MSPLSPHRAKSRSLQSPPITSKKAGDSRQQNLQDS